VAPDLKNSRIEQLLSTLVLEELDGLLVTHPPNIRYMSGFSGSAGILAVSADTVVLFTDPRYRTQAELEVDKAVRVEICSTDMWRRVWAVLGETPSLRTFGFESHSVTVRQASDIAKAKSIDELRPADSLVERQRVSKSPSEVESMRSAARLAVEALDRTLKRVRVGLTELQVAGMLEQELRVGGSERHPFPTIVASGPRSALPHAQTSEREIQSGDFLLLDFGAQVDGYCSDITRTVVVGSKADDRQREVYEMLERVQRFACNEIRAGMTGRAADALARKPIENAGFADAFEHSLGHGLGLEVHEEPRLSKTNKSELPVGAVVTVEPGVYLRGWGGIRIEDDVFLGENGPDLLSDGNSELREIT